MDPIYLGIYGSNIPVNQWIQSTCESMDPIYMWINWSNIPVDQWIQYTCGLIWIQNTWGSTDPIYLWNIGSNIPVDHRIQYTLGSLDLTYQRSMDPIFQISLDPIYLGINGSNILDNYGSNYLRINRSKLTPTPREFPSYYFTFAFKSEK